MVALSPLPLHRPQLFAPPPPPPQHTHPHPHPHTLAAFGVCCCFGRRQVCLVYVDWFEFHPNIATKWNTARMNVSFTSTAPPPTLILCLSVCLSVSLSLSPPPPPPPPGQIVRIGNCLKS